MHFTFQSGMLTVQPLHLLAVPLQLLCYPLMVFRLSERNFGIRHVIPILQGRFICGDEQPAVTYNQRRGESLCCSLTEAQIQYK